MFRITHGKGFQITFPNMVTVSVQFGIGSYCEHHFAEWIGGDYMERQRELGEKGSCNAEMAAFYVDGKGGWVHPDDWDDDVRGYCSPDEVLEFMNWAASLPKRK